ncbi:methyl-accepting chemotaxis protein [Pseudomonadota bacterium]
MDITYVNPAVVEMLAKRQNELRQIFPGFDAHNLVGQNIDQFHKNPSHQRGLLSDLSRLPVSSKLKLLDLTFQVDATAILGPDGEYMGNMVEWRDLTEQADAEEQMESLIVAAVAGDLEQRLDTSTYSGFMKGLGDQINSMLQAVVSPLRESIRVIQGLAEGDLTQAMAGEYEGEFAQLRDALNSSLANLQRMMGEISQSAGSISGAAGEISQGNTDLSQRTEEQASSIEETASTMEQMTSVVKQNADNARQANQLASGARDQAEKGGAVVGNAINAMSEINASSKKIEDIISVIDEIAFQTNLLALNAAVEAARAGEQGRGFAVVAGEVRSLAQRSAAAAKEIKGLIKDSVSKVEEGSRLVDESGQTLEEIVVASKKVSDIIAEIAAAGQEQASGIDQINKAITQLESVTQQNAALVEEAAAASESMANQSVNMQQLVGQFKTDTSMSQQQFAPPPAAALGQQQPMASPPPVARRAAPPPRPSVPRGDDEGDEWEEF